MWQVITSFLLFSFQSACAGVPPRINSAHLNEMRARYPFGLLGDDYGILTIADLAINACIAHPEPFSLDSIYYPYWQCFPTRTSSFLCDETGYDDEEKSIMAIVTIVLQKNGEEHEYLSRRAIPLAGCRNIAKDWERVTTGQEHVCLSGSLIRTETRDRAKAGHWIYESFKTSSGCVSYFDGGCGIKSGCEISAP